MDRPNGDRLWRLSVLSEGALSINLLYDDFHLPPGARFHIYSGDRRQYIGAFSERNNKPDRIFATGLIYGDDNLYAVSGWTMDQPAQLRAVDPSSGRTKWASSVKSSKSFLSGDWLAHSDKQILVVSKKMITAFNR